MNDPRLHAWSRPGLRGSLRWPPSTSRSVGQALADDAFHGQIGAGDIIDPEFGPVGVAKVELGQVAVKMGFADVLVDPVNAPLQDREVAFDGVRVDLISDVFLGRVIHGLVRDITAPDMVIDIRFIGHEPAVLVSVPGDDRIEVGRGDARHMEGTAMLYFPVQ